ncbi:DUF3857 domain-containing protein [Fulvivirga sedimenti]|uniref:DUF3857 domain-containing protein n=1 Tax=Fulvivirga sedimenti TaxID=2879465 RepID=A0A9X1KZU7_9BACT|nr:DUF3857 domain-containing protein [Fulvivirga sedimenti]MCA6078680.1 DUF3857 domain-containing protein [Fulvivirga sedimenti]
MRFFLLLVLFPFISNAQQAMKWGRYEDFEIDLTQVSYEPEASVVILGEVGRIYFDRHINYEVHTRLKILKEEGKDLVDRLSLSSVRFYNKDLTKMFNVRAQIRTPEGEKITLDKSQIVKTKLDEFLSEIRFVFPRLVPGTIIEFEYTYQYDDFYYIPTWYFQKQVPVLFSMLDARLPGGIVYRVSMQGNRLRKKYAERQLGTWSLVDLPSINPDPYIYNVNKYAEAVNFFLDSYEYMNIQHTYSSTRTVEFNTKSDIYRKYYLHDYYRGWLDDRYINSMEGINDLAGDNELQTTQNIYRYVQNNIAWTGEHNYFVGDNNMEVVRDRRGHSGEVNLLMRAILHKYSIPSDIVLVSTRSHGFPEESTPALNQFNHLILNVKVNDGILVDATEPFYDFATLPPKDQNFKGLIFEQDNPRWITIAPNLSKLTVNYQFDPAGRVVDARISATAHDAARLRQQWFNHGSLKLDYFNLPEYEPDSLRPEFPENYRLPVKIAARYISGGNELEEVVYIPAQLFKFYNEMPFREEKRSYPVELSYPFYRQMIGIINIPDGYVVDELPDKRTIELPNRLGHYRFDAAVMGNVIQINATLEIPALIVLPEYYADFRDMIQQVIAKQSEMIVLRRQAE